jgi:hypothetical protein
MEEEIEESQEHMQRQTWRDRCSLTMLRTRWASSLHITWSRLEMQRLGPHSRNMEFVFQQDSQAIWTHLEIWKAKRRSARLWLKQCWVGHDMNPGWFVGTTPHSHFYWSFLGVCIYFNSTWRNWGLKFGVVGWNLVTRLKLLFLT